MKENNSKLQKQEKKKVGKPTELYKNLDEEVVAICEEIRKTKKGTATDVSTNETFYSMRNVVEAVSKAYEMGKIACIGMQDAAMDAAMSDINFDELDM